MFKKLIVATDFSEASNRAARAAVDLAVPLKATVVLVHVISPGADYSGMFGKEIDVRAGIEGKLKELIATLASSGASLDWGVVDGEPAPEIATFATRWDGDMIVTGTLGRSGIGRALLGSVAASLVREAKVPVLVVGPQSG